MSLGVDQKIAETRPDKSAGPQNYETQKHVLEYVKAMKCNALLQA